MCFGPILTLLWVTLPGLDNAALHRYTKSQKYNTDRDEGKWEMYIIYGVDVCVDVKIVIERRKLDL